MARKFSGFAKCLKGRGFDPNYHNSFSAEPVILILFVLSLLNNDEENEILRPGFSGETG